MDRSGTPRRLWDYLTSPFRSTAEQPPTVQDGTSSARLRRRRRARARLLEAQHMLKSADVLNHRTRSTSDPGRPYDVPPEVRTRITDPGKRNVDGFPDVRRRWDQEQARLTPTARNIADNSEFGGLTSSDESYESPTETYTDADSKYGDSKDSSSGVVLNRRNLPKIDYGKVLTLSLTNFNEYVESVGRVGYSRKWSPRFYNPTLEVISYHVYPPVQESVDAEYSRREAYLVLSNTIPTTLSTSFGR